MERKVNKNDVISLDRENDSYKIITLDSLKGLSDNTAKPIIEIGEDCSLCDDIDDTYQINARGNLKCEKSIFIFGITSDKDFYSMSDVCMNMLKVKGDAYF